MHHCCLNGGEQLQYKGAIMNLDKETGISIMKIIPKLDAGPIMMKSKIKISENANYEIISKELSFLGAKNDKRVFKFDRAK